MEAGSKTVRARGTASSSLLRYEAALKYCSGESMEKSREALACASRRL
jgi:hypothetical protein